MSQNTIPFDQTQVIAVAPEPQKITGRQAFDQAIQREVQDAVARKEFEVAAMMEKAGCPINEFPNTPEGAQQLAAWMKEHDLQVDKLVFQDDFGRSGYYVKRAGIEIGMVPCEIVRGMMI